MPVSDSVLAVPLASLTAVSVFGLACFLGLPGTVLPVFEPGVEVAVGCAVAVGVAVGWTVTATVGAAVGVGVESVEPRSTIEAIGAGRPGICN